MRRAQLIAALLATAIAAALVPAAATAKMVPQENSAVSQYTEGFPTGGGETDSKTPGESGVTPGKAIGAKNAQKLEQHGSEGRQAAEVAAATAPPPVAESGDRERHGEGSGVGPKGGGSASGGGHSGSGGKSADAGNRGGSGEPAASGGGGSSAVGTIAGAATGAESGQLGLILPLFLLAALVWGCIYAVRNRKRSAPQ